MKEWFADIGGDPYDDHNLTIEIRYGCSKNFIGEYIAIIKQRPEGGLSITWYPHEEDIVVPVDWLLKLLSSAKEDLEGLRFIDRSE